MIQVRFTRDEAHALVAALEIAFADMSEDELTEYRPAIEAGGKIHRALQEEAR